MHFLQRDYRSDPGDPSIATRRPEREGEMENEKGFLIKDTDAIRNGLRKESFER